MIIDTDKVINDMESVIAERPYELIAYMYSQSFIVPLTIPVEKTKRIDEIIIIVKRLPEKGRKLQILVFQDTL